MTTNQAATQTRHRIIRWLQRKKIICGTVRIADAIAFIRTMDERQNKRKGGLGRAARMLTAALTLALAASGCAGTMTVRLPDGTSLTSARDTSFDELSYTVSGSNRVVKITKYVGRATEPINAQTVQLREVAKGVSEGLGAAALKTIVPLP